VSPFIRIKFTSIALCSIAALLFGQVATLPAGEVDCSTLGIPAISGESITSRPEFANALTVLQNNTTGFGDVAPNDPEPSTGNELDELFVTNDDTNLYFMVTGNTDRNDTLENTVILFIDTGDNGGTTVLNTAGCCAEKADPGCEDMACETCICNIDPFCCDTMGGAWSQACADLAFIEDDMETMEVEGCAGSCTFCAQTDPVSFSSALRNMHGVTLDFAPEFAIAMWNDNGDPKGVLVDLTADPNLPGTPLLPDVELAIDNSNLAGVNDEPALDPDDQMENAAGVTTGYEVAIQLTELSLVSTDTIDVQALLVGGTTGFISNQSLPPMRAGQGMKDCVGEQSPLADPPVLIDFTTNDGAPPNDFIGDQHMAVTLSSGQTPMITIDGSLDMDYGSSVAIQNNYTCFSDAAPFAPGVTQGSELNQIFVTRDNNKLYIGITGNVPSPEENNNTIIIFLDSVPFFMEQNPLTTSGINGGSGALREMSGLEFDDDFFPEFALEYWRGGNRHNGSLVSLPDGVRTDLGPGFTFDLADATMASSLNFTANLGNLAGVNDIPGDDPLRQELFATSATNGVQFAIPLSDIAVFDPGSTTIKVTTCITSGSGFISNQWLPPLNPTDLDGEQNVIEGFTPGTALADEDVTENTQSLTMAGPIEHINEIEVSVNIAHPAIETLNVDLRYENDDDVRTVRLWEGNASGTDLNLTFAENGDDLENYPAGGPFQPVESLLTFNGADPNEGTWTLVVEDTAAGDVGTLVSWSLNMTFIPGGGVDCLDNVDAVINPIDLGDDMVFPGLQYFEVDLGNMANQGAPTLFNGTDIPDNFLNDAFATQNNHTCFGNAVEAAPVNPPGSELDQMLVTNTDDRLRVALTGNLENNGNAVILLLDTDDMAGSNVISGITSPPNPLGGNGGNEPGLNGMTLDTGFTPDWALVLQRNDPAAPADSFSVFLTDLNTNFTRTIGRLNRNSGSGLLGAPLPNGNGSELDMFFAQNDDQLLYLGITGNLENNGNAFVVFLETGAGGNPFLSTNTLDFPAPIRALNNSAFDAGFAPTHAILVQRTGGNPTAQLMDLPADPMVTPPVVTNLTLEPGVGANPTLNPNTFVFSNTNALGVNSDPADDDDMGMPPSQQILNARTAVDGVQFALDRADIGTPADGQTIRLNAILVSGNGFWSNQTLPGLGGGVANLANNPQDLSVQPGDQFTSFDVADNVMAPYESPGTFTGQEIVAAMGDPMAADRDALATQDNHTGFGNAALPPNAGNPNCMQVAFNDSNIVGVLGADCPPDAPATGAETAETGMEFDIPFADLGLTPLDMGGEFIDVKALAMVTGGFGFLSNQFLPPVGDGTECNLAAADTVDLNTFPDDQFLTYSLMVPCTAVMGDFNNDSQVDLADITPFVEELLGNTSDACIQSKADFNGDMAINGLDVAGFVAELTD